MDRIIATATRRLKCLPSWRYPKDYGISVTAQAYQIAGNTHPHFSVTGSIGVFGRDPRVCGCIHDEARQVWPAIGPIIALHLSNADDGEPMHVEANGWYWLAGALGGLGKKYHGGNSNPLRSPDECLTILARHLRITIEDARALAATVDDAFGGDRKQVFHTFIEAQRPRWQREANDGLALIARLAADGDA